MSAVCYRMGVNAVRRRFAMALFVAASSCRALIGIEDYQPLLQDAGVADVSSDAEASAREGGSVRDVLDADAERDAFAVDVDKLRDDLARNTVRLGDKPPFGGRWFLSRTRVYVVDGQNQIRSYVPSSGQSVGYTFGTSASSEFAGNDDVVVVKDDDGIRAYSADQPDQLMMALPPGYNQVQVASKSAVLLDRVGGGDTAVALWDPAAGTAPAEFHRGPLGAYFLRGHGDTLCFSDGLRPEFWTLDVAKKAASMLPLPRKTIEADVSSVGLVIQYNEGGIRFGLVVGGRISRDLFAEVMSAESFLGREQRKPLMAFALKGNWLIYAATSGILAFDIEHRRLVPLQLRTNDDGLYEVPRILDVPGMVVFERNAGPAQSLSKAGLYAVPLTSVLPR